MKKIQASESVIVGVMLALAGGFMDAYSYIVRGGVFANAETGNIVLFAINIMNMKFVIALKYLIPIVAFAVGVYIAEYLRQRKETIATAIHWRQITILLEIVLMITVAFLPQKYNLLVNSMISLTCGIQVAAFAKIRGYGMATTMCTGNLRSGTQNISTYFRSGNDENLKAGLFYYGCILCFIVGAMIGGFFSNRIRESASFIVAGFLAIVFVVMFFNKSE